MKLVLVGDGVDGGNLFSEKNEPQCATTTTMSLTEVTSSRLIINDYQVNLFS